MFEGRFVEPESTNGDKVEGSNISNDDEALLFDEDDGEKEEQPNPPKTTRVPSQETTIKNQRPTYSIPNRNTDKFLTDQKSNEKPVTENVDENINPMIHETIPVKPTDFEPVNNYTLNQEPQQDEKKRGNFFTNTIKKIINLFN